MANRSARRVRRGRVLSESEWLGATTPHAMSARSACADDNAANTAPHATVTKPTAGGVLQSTCTCRAGAQDCVLVPNV